MSGAGPTGRSTRTIAARRREAPLGWQGSLSSAEMPNPSIKRTSEVIVHAFVKKTQQTPDKELKLARKRAKELLNG